MPSEWNVLLPETIDPAGPESIADIATFTSIGEYDDRDAFLADCGRFEAMVVRVTELSAAVFEAADALEVVAKHGAGLDNVDIPAATEHGVIVCNTPGVNARSVAEHALTLVLVTRNRVLAADRHLETGGWDRHRFTSRELAGDTLGLFGFGDIARELVDVASGLNLEWIAYDPFVDRSAAPDRVTMVGSVAQLFARSDLVSVHAPLTDDTYHAIGESELGALGPEGAIVNTARGGIVDETELRDALKAGELGAAGLDVFEREPPSADNPLLARDDVVTTPHIGGLTEEALERMSRGAAANVRTVYEGGLPESTVNAAELPGE